MSRKHAATFPLPQQVSLPHLFVINLCGDVIGAHGTFC